MHVSTARTTTFEAPALAAFGLLGRLAAAAQSAGATPPRPATPTGDLVTADMVRAALLAMGAGASAGDVAVAEALVRAGMPLTAASLAEAHGALAAAPAAPPEAYALAKSLALPTTPAALTALTGVLCAPSAAPSPTRDALPERVRAWLGLGLTAGTPSEALARGLREMVGQAGRSTEHRLLSAARDGQTLPIADARTALLRLAHASADAPLRAEADGLASLLEGQQLLNGASAQAHAGRAETPLYFALPLSFGNAPGTLEMRLWSRERETRERETNGGDEPDAAPLRVTLRVAPPKLGRVQADLSGASGGGLSCRLGVERAGTRRLLVRHAETLADALGAAGWPVCEVSCRPQSEWPPLWHGGERLATPRPCVDRHV